MSMTVEEMKVKLSQWQPYWNLERFTDSQIVNIYNKERNKILKSILEKYPESS